MSLIIGISGGTGSGKTTVANRILETVKASEVVFIQQDSYYRNLKDLPLDYRQVANFDHPDALDNDLLVNHVRKLRAGEPIDLPIYDFRTHTRLPATTRIESKPIVILEGILIFAEPRLLEQMDIKVFVDTPDDIRFIRRLRRDIAERGRTVESVIEQYIGTVRPMHMQFVEPSKRHADVIIPEGGHNRVAIEMIVAKIQRRLQTLLEETAHARVFRTAVGAAEPLRAIADELLEHPGYDTLVICTLPPGISRWLKLDLVHRAERKFGVRVIHVVAEAAAQARG